LGDSGSRGARLARSACEDGGTKLDFDVRNDQRNERNVWNRSNFFFGRSFFPGFALFSAGLFVPFRLGAIEFLRDGVVSTRIVLRLFWFK
jgi:hypothetical protein